MSVETIAATAGLLLSLAAAYLPGFSTRFARLDGVHKRLVMLLMLALAALGGYLAECRLPAWTGVTACDPALDRSAALTALRLFLAALVANQSTYLIASPRASVTWEVGRRLAEEIAAGRSPAPGDAGAQARGEASRDEGC